MCSMSHIYKCENAETVQAGRRATHVHDRIPVLDYFLFLQRDADEKSGGDGGGRHLRKLLFDVVFRAAHQRH